MPPMMPVMMPAVGGMPDAIADAHTERQGDEEDDDGREQIASDRSEMGCVVMQYYAAFLTLAPPGVCMRRTAACGPKPRDDSGWPCLPQPESQAVHGRLNPGTLSRDAIHDRSRAVRRLQSSAAPRLR